MDLQELHSGKAASDQASAEAAAEKVRAESLAKALAELQPELAAARAAGEAQKEAHRLTIDRRSQELAATKQNAAATLHKMQSAITKLTQEVRDSQAAAEAAAAEGDRLRALAHKVAAAAAEEKRGLAASTESMKRKLEALESERLVQPQEEGFVAKTPAGRPLGGKTPGRRPLGLLDGNSTPTQGIVAGSPAKGTPLRAWRKAHPRRAAIAARAALKGGKPHETAVMDCDDLIIPADQDDSLVSSDDEAEVEAPNQSAIRHRHIAPAPQIGTRSRLRNH